MPGGVWEIDNKPVFVFVPVSGGSCLVVRDDDDEAVGIIPSTIVVAVREGSTIVAIIPVGVAISVRGADAISPVGSAVGIVPATIAVRSAVGIISVDNDKVRIVEALSVDDEAKRETVSISEDDVREAAIVSEDDAKNEAISPVGSVVVPVWGSRTISVASVRGANLVVCDDEST